MEKNIDCAEIGLKMNNRRIVTICNHNFSEEGIYHPDRTMDEYDLLYMQSGEWDIVEEGVTYHVVPGQILCLEPGRHHYSEGKCSPNMRNAYIHFRHEKGDCLSGGKIASGNILKIGKVTDIGDKHEITHLFEKVIEAFFTFSGDERDLRCSIYLEELLALLSDINSRRSGTVDILVEEIIHSFYCNLDRFLSPQELADMYHVSLRTVSGRFKDSTGMSIHQYQMKLKLDMAYDALPFSPGRPLKDVAKSYGFYDEFQFSKLFKRQFGVTPSERR